MKKKPDDLIREAIDGLSRQMIQFPPGELATKQALALALAAASKNVRVISPAVYGSPNEYDDSNPYFGRQLVAPGGPRQPAVTEIVFDANTYRELLTKELATIPRGLDDRAAAAQVSAAQMRAEAGAKAAYSVHVKKTAKAPKRKRWWQF